MSCIGGGDDSGVGGSKPSGSIALKLSKESAYDPEKHCIFCLDASTGFFKLSSSDNGRTKVLQVILTSHYSLQLLHSQRFDCVLTIPPEVSQHKICTRFILFC